MNLESSVGKTRYVISDDGLAPQFVGFTRYNSDGETKVYFPKSLVVEYVIELITPDLKKAFKKMVKPWF